MKEKKSIQNLKAKADSYLNELETLEQRAGMIADVIQMEIKAINDRYAQEVAWTADKIKKTGNNLKKFIKANNADLFDKTDQISLPHGIILYTEGDKVTIPKTALEAIEKLGWKEGYIETRKIDRPTIEAWSDEKLIAIGASRKPAVSVNWELTNVKKDSKK